MSDALPRNVLLNVARVPGAIDDYERARKSEIIEQQPIEGELIKGDPEVGPRFRRLGGVGTVSRKPHVDALMTSSYLTLWEELKRLQEAAVERPLTESEARRYHKYVEDLSRLMREEREQRRADKLDELSHEELIVQAEEALKILEANDVRKVSKK